MDFSVTFFGPISTILKGGIRNTCQLVTGQQFMLPCTVQCKVQLVNVSANEGRVDYFILDLKSRWSIIRVGSIIVF